MVSSIVGVNMLAFRVFFCFCFCRQPLCCIRGCAIEYSKVPARCVKHFVIANFLGVSTLKGVRSDAVARSSGTSGSSLERSRKGAAVVIAECFVDRQ